MSQMSKIIYESKWLKLICTVFKNKLGEEKEWFWVKRTGSSKAVVIVATMRERLVVIKEKRIPLDDYQWALPAGLVDSGESTREAAVRELKEETGLEVTRIHYETPYVYSTAGITDEAVSMVYCEADGIPDSSGLDICEDITVFIMDREQIKSLIHDETKKIGTKAYLIMKHFVEMSERSFRDT